jgi:hypothetical protein
LSKQICVASVVGIGDLKDRLREQHDSHHLGVDRTLHLALERFGSSVSKKDVEEVVKECHVCRRVDPAPVRWETGHVDVDEDWYRLATDITHYKGVPYLTVIDCGPSRLAIWRRLTNESSSAVSKQLDHIFCERGAPVEMLSDNGPCYRSLNSLLEKWGINQIYSCAYRASGNGLIERNHRTIKRMLARSGGTVNDMLYWYNNSPHADGVVPFRKLFSYEPQKPVATEGAKRDTSLNPYKVGDQVYVKPANVRCTSVWKVGNITALVSNTAVKVDNMTRHVGDIRFCWRPDKHAPSLLDCEIDISNRLEQESVVNSEHQCEDNSDNVEDDDCRSSRPVRARKPPDFYVAGFT